MAQDLETPEGSYWHAIIHRLEPDEWNSNYWSRRAGPHAIHAPLLEEAREILRVHPGGKLLLGNRWDPEAFTRLCEEARGKRGSAVERTAILIQQAEWSLLFRWCGMRR